MKFKKNRKVRKAPYYSKEYRESKKETMYTEIGKSITSGKDYSDIIKAYNITVNPAQ